MCDTRICKICNIEKPINKYPYSKYKEKCYYHKTCYSCRSKIEYDKNKDNEVYMAIKSARSQKYKQKKGIDKIRKQSLYRYHLKVNERKSKNKKWRGKVKNNLSDYYVKQCLVNNSAFLDIKDIPQELVEIKRKQLQIIRDAKKAKENNRK